MYICKTETDSQIYKLVDTRIESEEKGVKKEKGYGTKRYVLFVQYT